jgi:dTDP-4-amino-4,6-dideoxygalactose transaminase
MNKIDNGIVFNKPFLEGRELEYIDQAVSSGKISGNGEFTNKCQDFFQSQYQFNKCLLTTSCTDALEMAAILCEVGPGDEVIVPSYTFVSTANAFILRGASIVFADSRPDHPGMDEDVIEELINKRTRVIVVVHYAGVSCDMDKIMALAEKYGILVVEDAAQAVESTYKNKPLGGIGHFGCFSFHETKNIQCGEGGMLVINDERFAHRAEIIWEKGTNRAEFFRGEVNKYGWVDIGSSFLPSEITAAFLWAQLQNIELIQARRKFIVEFYEKNIRTMLRGFNFSSPLIPCYAVNNWHMFYLVCNNGEERDNLISFCRSKGVHAVFHYLSLHRSQFFSSKHDGRALPQSDRYSDCLVRLPLFYELDTEDLFRRLTGSEIPIQH